MPRKTTAYACCFGCGFYSEDKTATISHEKLCIWSPSSRACTTCIKAGLLDSHAPCSVNPVDRAEYIDDGGCPHWTGDGQ